MEGPFESDHRARVEGLQVKCIEIQLFSGCRVACQEYLEATVKLEPIHNVCAHSPSDVVTGLQHTHRQTYTPEDYVS